MCGIFGFFPSNIVDCRHRNFKEREKKNSTRDKCVSCLPLHGMQAYLRGNTKNNTKKKRRNFRIVTKNLNKDKSHKADAHTLILIDK